MFPCAFSPWSPGLHDNFLLGWMTVGVYLAAAYACSVAARRGHAPDRTARREQLFWWFCTVLLVFLALNKQLDLQSLLTSAARCLAVDQGWYEDRRSVQRWFVMAIMAGGALFVILCGVFMRSTLARTGVAILGLGVIGAFVGSRASSLHHIDSLLDTRVLGARLNLVLELTGPMLILVTAVGGRRRHSAGKVHARSE